MFNLIRERLIQGRQYIRDVRKAEIAPPFRGFPEIAKTSDENWKKCADGCPTGAVELSPPGIDLGRCVFCGECERACPGAIRFNTRFRTAAGNRDQLFVRAGESFDDYRRYAVVVRKEIRGLFGRSLSLRSVSAGGCGACELELNASSNVNFDMGRFGIEISASPRHADGIVITGPVTTNMAAALRDTYQSIPQPKIVILMGSCAISGGLFHDTPAVDRSFLDTVRPDLYVPGCPVHPLTFVNGVLDFLGRK